MTHYFLKIQIKVNLFMLSGSFNQTPDFLQPDKQAYQISLLVVGKYPQTVTVACKFKVHDPTVQSF